MSSIMVISDAPSCGITYDHHSDNSTGIIYDRNMFMVEVVGGDDSVWGIVSIHFSWVELNGFLNVFVNNDDCSVMRKTCPVTLPLVS